MVYSVRGLVLYSLSKGRGNVPLEEGVRPTFFYQFYLYKFWLEMVVFLLSHEKGLKYRIPRFICDLISLNSWFSFVH